LQNGVYGGVEGRTLEYRKRESGSNKPDPKRANQRTSLRWQQNCRRDELTGIGEIATEQLGLEST